MVQRGGIGDQVAAYGQRVAVLVHRIDRLPSACVPGRARLHALQAQQKLTQHIGVVIEIEHIGNGVFHHGADGLHAVAGIAGTQGVKADAEIAGVQAGVVFGGEVEQVDALVQRSTAEGEVAPAAAGGLGHGIHVEMGHA